MLLERCVPGEQLRQALPEREQDVVIAGLIRRLWARELVDGQPFGSLARMCDQWADWFERDCEPDSRGFDPGLARAGMAVLRELPRSADRSVLLCTDLHAGNVLFSRRESWLVIDPKPFIGDPALSRCSTCSTARSAWRPTPKACRAGSLSYLSSTPSGCGCGCLRAASKSPSALCRCAISPVVSPPDANDEHGCFVKVLLTPSLSSR